MHPLNRVAWSLFFEYIANILYAIGIRRFSKTALSILLVIAANALAHLAITNGDVRGGWTLNVEHVRIGLTRTIYPFFAGLLLSRVAKPTRIKNAICSDTWCVGASLLFEKLTIHKPWNSFKFVSHSILFGVLAYLFTSLFIKFWNWVFDAGWNELDIMRNIASKEIPFVEIGNASVTGIILGLISSAIILTLRPGS